MARLAGPTCRPRECCERHAAALRHSCLEHLSLQDPLQPSQEPDVTRILPSSAFSQTSAVLSVVASFSRTFSRFSVLISPPARPALRVTARGCPIAQRPLSLFCRT